MPEADGPPAPTRVTTTGPGQGTHPEAGSLDTPPPYEPRVLGTYRLLELIGEGGMGLVYRAQDTRLGREVAVKVMRSEYAAHPVVRARFLREGKAQARVESPLVVPIHAAEEQDGVPFIVMPLLRGHTLERRLQQGDLPLAAAVRVCREVTEGLAAVHAAGLIHRDIKPGNIWLDESDRARLMDFGVARLDLADGLKTVPGQVLGTPAFMSPEQAEGSTVDQRADIYSLGCVLHLLLTGERPRLGQSPSAADIRSRAADVPTDLAELTARMLAADPARRPPSAAAVAEELRRIETKFSAPPPRRGWWLLAGIGAACILLALALFFWPRQQGPQEDDMPGKPPPKTGFPPLPAGWAASLEKMTRDEQREALRKEMMRRNPGWDGKVAFSVWGAGRKSLSAHFTSCEIADLSPLAALPGLKEVGCPGELHRPGKLVSLEPLRGLPLLHATLAYNPIRDLSPLEGMPLTGLWLGGIEADDFSPIYTLKRLQCLHLISESRVARLDAAKLDTMPLHEVWFRPSQVDDFGRLRRWKRLETLNGLPAALFWDGRQLRGHWTGPALLLKGQKGLIKLHFRFLDDSSFADAAFEFTPEKGPATMIGPYVVALKMDGKKRLIVLSRQTDDKAVEVGAVSYEVSEDRLKLSDERKLNADELGGPVSLAGEWRRR
jgi:serine/threonine protein kinase